MHGRPATPAADLWALGASQDAAVERRPPYLAPNGVLGPTAILSRDPDPPVHAGPPAPVPAGLLRKDPARRVTADQAARALRDLATGETAAP